MADRLAFVEVPGQIAHVPSDYHIVSLSPIVEVALEQAGRSYTRPEDYLDEVAMMEEGIANFDRVERLCAALDAIFAETVLEVSERTIQPARWHFLWLKKVYDAFSIRAYQLRRVLLAETPQRALYFYREQPDLSREWICQSESLYAALLDHLLPAFDIAAERSGPISEPEEAPQKESINALFWRARRGAGKKVRNAQEILRGLFTRRDRGKVLCLDYENNIPLIAPELKRLGYEVWVWKDGLTVHRQQSLNKCTLKAPEGLADHHISRVWKTVENSDVVRSLLVWEGHDLWPTVSPRLRRLVMHGLGEVLYHYAAARSALEQIRPNAVLLSVAALPREKAICHAARKADIPSIVSRHGEVGTRYLPITAYQDIDSVSLALCWGEWEARWTRHYSRIGTQALVVGSPTIENTAQEAPCRADIRRQLGYSEDQKIILYIPTLSGGNNWYASYMPTDNDYFRHCRKVIRTLLGIGGWKVVIKEHHSVSGSPIEACCRFIDACSQASVIRHPGFFKLIHLADAVVLDVPSTTLVQALTGTARIYLVDLPFSRWEPGVVEHLTASGVIFCSAENLKDRLAVDINSGFLAQPCSYSREAIEPLVAVSSDLGGARSRAARGVSQIMSGDMHLRLTSVERCQSVTP